MYSVEFDINIIKGDELVDIDLLNPHEKIIKSKQTKLTNFIKSFDEYYIISSILCCHKSHVIIDGHHRYFALKELGFKKVPVTKIDYSSDLISTGPNGEGIPKDEIINKGVSNELFEPKSTKHLIYCSRSKAWHPIILLSTMFKIDTNN
jgi:hypothetical protein